MLIINFGYNNIITDPYKLKRLSVSDSGDINELIVKSSGVWMFFKKIIVRDLGYGYYKKEK